jgi:hypothetical protein
MKGTASKLRKRKRSKGRDKVLKPKAGPIDRYRGIDRIREAKL